MTSLYHITTSITELEHVLEQIEEQGETYEGSSEDIAQFLLAPKEEELAEKVDNYVSYCRSLKATAKMQREEARHLYDMAKANENRVERLKEAAKWAAQQLERKKLQGNTRTITISTPKRPAIDVMDIALIPVAYKEQVFDWKIDKKGIVEHLMETGEVFEGIEYRKVTKVLMR